MTDFWEKDLFSRRTLAQDIILYTESVASNGLLLDDERSLVVAIDSDYGLGKTFLLQGLVNLLKPTHPVAYIDAWADDILDEPLIALAAMLKSAATPFIQQDPSLKRKWEAFARKAGKVVMIASKGLIKRGAGIILTSGAVAGISEILDTNAAGDEGGRDLGEDITEGLIEDIEDNLRALTSDTVLQKKIEAFDEGQKSIESMRKALSSFVIAVGASGQELPIYIIIDELDRCRPSYAIKLLEEIKHLFAVPNIVFILCTNLNQLEKAVAGEYGNLFDGRSYLDRFIDRRIELPYPDVEKLCASFLRRIDPGERISLANCADKQGKPLALVQYLGRLLAFYRISPRRTYKFFDKLQTALALIGSLEVDFIYLTELVAADVAGGHIERERAWQFGFSSYRSDWQWIEADSVVKRMRELYSMSSADAQRVLAGDDPFTRYLSFGVNSGQVIPARGYPEVLTRVGALGVPA